MSLGQQCKGGSRIWAVGEVQMGTALESGILNLLLPNRSFRFCRRFWKKIDDFSQSCASSGPDQPSCRVEPACCYPSPLIVWEGTSSRPLESHIERFIVSAQCIYSPHLIGGSLSLVRNQMFWVVRLLVSSSVDFLDVLILDSCSLWNLI